MQKLIIWLSSLGVSLAIVCNGWAISPVPIDQHANVGWSALQENPFDGKLVYDKHFNDGFAFVTMWSRRAIRATFTRYWRERVGYRWVWRHRYVWHNNRQIKIDYRDRERVYASRSSQRIPKALLFAIDGKVHRYESGEVKPELANALANAPAGMVTVRVVWEDDSFWDAPIGAGTVATWREVFR